MTRMLAYLYAVLAMALMSLGINATAMETPAPAERDLEIVSQVDNRMKNTFSNWALNSWKPYPSTQTLQFRPAGQPCYFAAVKSGSGWKRGCAIPAFGIGAARVLQPMRWPSVRGSGDYECSFARPLAAIMLPRMIAALDDAGLAGSSERQFLADAAAFLAAWKAAHPDLGKMNADGSCTVTDGGVPISIHIQLPPH